MATVEARRVEIPAAAPDPPELDRVLYRVQVLGGGIGDGPSSDDDDDEDDVVLPRSGSITTSTSFNRRSLSPSVHSQSTTATSRSSHEHAKGSRKPVSRPTSPGKAHSTTDYHASATQAQHPSPSPARSVASPSWTHPPPSPRWTPSSWPTPSLAPSSSHAPRKPYDSIRRRLTQFSRTKKGTAGGEVSHCARCRRGTRKSGTLQVLDCGHRYCGACLHQLIMTVMRTAKTIPVTCCKQPVAAAVLKPLLSEDERDRFVRMVVELDTARRLETSCPECQEELLFPESEFVLEMACGGCSVRVCRRCLSKAHPEGDACSADWTLEILWHMCAEDAWTQCKQCTRVHLVEGRERIVCDCQTEICSTCGSAIHSLAGTCPSCDASSRVEVVTDSPIKDVNPEVATVEVTAVDPVQLLEQLTAKARSLANLKLRKLRRSQLEQQRRFLAFEQQQKWILWTRHGQQKVKMLDRHAELEQRMRERHLETANMLEERHLAAEMELRQSLAQEERACQIRLRHMEDYCNMAGVGAPSPTPVKEHLHHRHRPYTGRKTSSRPSFPLRTVTERDLRELHQQYHLRDDMSRLHAARINVLRDTQARQVETVEKKQSMEMHGLVTSTFEPEMEALEGCFAREETMFERRFGRRRERLRCRWKREEEELRERLQDRTGKRYAPLPEVSWMDPGGRSGIDHQTSQGRYQLEEDDEEDERGPKLKGRSRSLFAETMTIPVRPSSKLRWSSDGVGIPIGDAREESMRVREMVDDEGGRKENDAAESTGEKTVRIKTPSTSSSFLLL